MSAVRNQRSASRKGMFQVWGMRFACWLICRNPSAAAEANDQAAAVDEQIFPAYDQYDPGPGYDGFTNRRAPVISCPRRTTADPLSCDEICHGMNLDFAAGPVKMRA